MSENQKPAAPVAVQDANVPHFEMLRVYISNASVEMPHQSRTFEMLGPQPDIQVALNMSMDRLDAEHFQVHMRATAKSEKDGRDLFVVEVAQTGLFRARNIPAPDREIVENVNSAHIVFPYLRASFHDLLVRAGLPPLMLPEMNWLAAWEQQKAQAAASATPALGAPAANAPALH